MIHSRSGMRRNERTSHCYLHPQHPEKKQRIRLKKPNLRWGVCGVATMVGTDDEIVTTISSVLLLVMVVVVVVVAFAVVVVASTSLSIVA